MRDPQNIVQEIKEAIKFHERKYLPRIITCLWITDDNFAHNRKWAMSVLQAIIDNKIKYNFAVQARYEIGFDKEMLKLIVSVISIIKQINPDL